MAIFAGSNTAQAATSSTLNFQGRLRTNSGGLVPDGSYNIEFKLYNASTIDGGETLVQGACQTNPGPVADEDCLWVESRTGVDTVTVKNGYFSVQLGSVTAFPGTINWDQELWLGMNIGGAGAPTWDGEMTPRFKLTAVPYAFRAGALVDASGNAKTADDLAQIAPSAIQTANAAVAALRLNQTGAGGLLQLQGNGSDVFTVDKLGNTVLGAGITVGNSSATTAGTIRWTGTELQVYDGAVWTSLNGGGAATAATASFVTAAINLAGTTTAATTGLFDVTNTTTFSTATGSTTFVAPKAGSFRSCLVVGNANRTAGTATLRWRVNGASVGSGACVIDGTNVRTSTTALDVGVVTFAQGDTISVVFDTAALTPAGTTEYTVYWSVSYETATSTGSAFVQGGNSFAGTAVLGTNDANGLQFETNNTARMTIDSSGNVGIGDTTPLALFTVGAGDAFRVNNTGDISTSGGLTVTGTSSLTGLTTLGSSLLASNSATVTTGSTTGSGTNTTTLNLTADAFSVNDVVFIDNVGQDYYTRVTVDPGTGSYTVSPAVTYTNNRTVTKYTIQNIGATPTDYTTQANRFFQGYFLGGVVVGAGSTTIGDGSIESTTALNIQSGGGDVNIGGALIVTGAITGDGSGLTNIDGSVVDGATVTALNASNISSGTLADGRLSSNVTLLGNSFNGASQLVQLDVSGNLPVLNGAALTNLSAGNLTGALAALDGSALTSLNASNIASGTLNDGRLSANVALLSGAQSFSGAKTFDAGLVISASQTVSINGEAYSDLTGTGLAFSSGSLSVAYGSIAGTAVQGDVTLTCPSGSGNLSGGGTVITLGAGGTCSALSITNSPTFTTSVTSPSFTSTGAVTLSSGGGLDLTIDSASNVVLLSDSTLRRTAVGTTSLQLNDTANTTFSITNTDGTAVAGLSVEGDVAGLTFTGDGSLLTSLNASNISSGTLADGRLSTNVALLSGTQTFSGDKTFSGGFVLGQTTLSSSATVSRAVSLPDEAGTICLSNKDTCGYIRLASGSTQTDATANNTISINKTNATGNLIDLQRSGGAVFTVANTGSLQIQATGTAALDIRNVGGTSYFSVDSSTGAVRVGSSVADATGVLFVLDTKNTTGDPTGINGGSYYNSADARTRCYENGFWSDCSTTRILGETTLGAAANTINVTLSTSTEYLECRVDIKSRTLASGVYLRFNNDIGGASYGWNEYDIINTAVGDAQDSSDSEIQLNGTDTGTIPASAELRITNFADTQKIVDWSYSAVTGIGTNNRRYSGTGNWSNVATQISSVQFISSAGNFAAGSHAWCEGRDIR